MRERLNSLTGLRGLAAFVIFWHHAVEVGWLRHVVGQGRVAVEFFFILSGFVLMWTRSEQGTAGRFYRRRFARIYPSYIVVWLGTAMLATHINFDSAPPSGGNVLVGGLLLQAWVPHEATYYAVDAPAWSLSAEAFFYLTFPLWASAVARSSDLGVKRVLFGCILLVFGVAAVGQLIGPGGDLLTSNPDTFTVWLVRTLPATRILEFVAGACLAVMLKRGTLPPVRLRWAAIACLATYAVAGFPTLLSSSMVMLIPLMMLVTACAQADIANRRTVFTSRLMVWAGGISYCFYLVQLPVIALFDLKAHSLPERVFVELAVTILLGSVLHYLVERPYEKLLRPHRTQSRAQAAIAEEPQPSSGLADAVVEPG